MERFVREHTGPVAALLSAVALALVFSAALRAVPGWLLPTAPEWVLGAIPHVNAAISLAAIATIVVGWRAIRRGDVARHRQAMLATTGLFATFLAAYLYRVAVKGPTEFAAPNATVELAYYALLAVHIVFAVVCVPLVIYALLLALTRPVRDLRATRHAGVGRVAAALWLVSFALGVTVYAMLYVLF